MTEEIDRDGTVIMLRHKVKILEYELRKAEATIAALEMEVVTMENSNHNLWMRVNDYLEKEESEGGTQANT